MLVNTTSGAFSNLSSALVEKFLEVSKFEIISQIISQNKSHGTNTTDADTYHRYLHQDIIILCLYALITVVAFFGNCLVFKVMLNKKGGVRGGTCTTRSTTNILIANLAVSDILGALVIPGQWALCSHWWMASTSKWACGFGKLVQALSYNVDTFTMTAIAVDRYRIVRNPFSARIDPTRTLMVIWSLGTLLATTTLIQMRVWTYFGPARLMDCQVLSLWDDLNSNSDAEAGFRKARFGLVLTWFLGQYLVPLTIAGTLYGLAIKKLWGQQRPGSVTGQQMAFYARAKMRTIRMMAIAVAAFALCWLPVHVIHIVDWLNVPIMPQKCNLSLFYLLFYWLAISSISYNPFIYYWFNRDFRESAKKVFVFWRSSKN